MILYLDFDGVLHPAEDILLDAEGKPFLQHPDPAAMLFMHAPILEELLAPYPELKIVLSTSWAYQFGTEGAAAYLPEGLRSRVIDKISHSMLPRGVLIAKHAAQHLEGGEWLAVDDTIRMWPPKHLHRLVQCDSELGLGCEETQQKLRRKLLLLKMSSESDRDAPLSDEMREWEEMKPVGAEWGEAEDLDWEGENDT